MDKKKKKILIISAAVLLIVVIIYFVFFRKPKLQSLDEEVKNINTGGTASLNTPSAPTANDALPLKAGSKGQRVINVQNAVNKLAGIDLIKVDGIYGSSTRNGLVYIGSEFGFPLDSKLYLKLITMAADAS